MTRRRVLPATFSTPPSGVFNCCFKADLPSFFVWYRVNQDDRDTETAVRSMMARLACRSGVCGRLLKKRDEPGLWMETYADVADPVRFEHMLRQAVDEFDIEIFIDGKRTTECFLSGEPIPAACA